MDWAKVWKLAYKQLRKNSKLQVEHLIGMQIANSRQLKKLNEISQIADAATKINRANNDPREPGTIGAVKALVKRLEEVQNILAASQAREGAMGRELDRWGHDRLCARFVARQRDENVPCDCNIEDAINPWLLGCAPTVGSEGDWECLTHGCSGRIRGRIEDGREVLKDGQEVACPKCGAKHRADVIDAGGEAVVELTLILAPESQSAINTNNKKEK